MYSLVYFFIVRLLAFVRDLQRLGHLGLGKKAYWESARIPRRDGVIFPAGGVRAAWNEK